MPVHIFLYFTSEWCLARNSSDHNVKWAIPFHEWHSPPKEDIGFHWHPLNILDVPVAYKLPYPPPSSSIFFTITNQPIPLPRVKNCHPHPQIFIFQITHTIPHPYIFSHPHPKIFIFCNTPSIPTFFSHTPWGEGTKKIYGGGVINWGLGGGGGWNSAVHGNCVPQTCGTQNSARQLCAANLRRTLCTRTVRDNCALQTCGAHCVPEQCATIVRRKLVAHIVCQNSAPEN